MVQSRRSGDCPDETIQAGAARASEVPAQQVAESPAACPDADPTGPQPAKPSFQQLARRISSWTSRLLLSALILVVGLAFGRQVLHWWRADPVGPGLGGVLGPGTGRPGPRLDAVQVICFGRAGWTLRQRQLLGDRQSALGALRAECRRAAEVSKPSQAEPPALEERSLVARLASQLAVEREPGRWRMYELDEGVPMVVVLTDEGIADASTEGDHLVAASAGVITWGMAVPQGDCAWTVYAFQPESSTATASSDRAKIALPPEADRVLVLETADGSSVAGFEMAGPADRARGVFDRWYAEHGWTATGPWQGLGEAWCRRFESQDSQRPCVADVRVGVTADGRMRGVVTSCRLPALQTSAPAAP